MRKQRLTEEERQFCKFGAYNIVDYSNKRKESVVQQSIPMTYYGGKFYDMVPPEVYLKCPEAYENERYLERVKSILSIYGISVVRRTTDFKQSKTQPTYLWCSL